MSALIGIDLGGTKTEVAVLAGDGAVLFRHRQATPRDDYTAILDTIQALVDEAIAHTGIARPQAIGCGIPGCLDPDTHTVRGANTLVLNGQLFQSDLAQRLQCRVHVQNDANCLAVSEAVDGAGKGSGVVFAAILGTGCGGGIAFQGKAWAGRHAIAGEWGHNPLPWPTLDELQVPACWCGQVGCLETWISGTGFASDHARQFGGAQTAVQLIQAMRKGDAQALLSFDRFVTRLARGLAATLQLFKSLNRCDVATQVRRKALSVIRTGLDAPWRRSSSCLTPIALCWAAA